MTEAPDESNEPSDRPTRRGRRIAAVTGSVLLAGAVVAGVGLTAVTVDGADRAPGAPSWEFPGAAAGTMEKESASQGLAGMLLPYGDDGLLRGPDLPGFGSDAQLSDARATALQKESLHGLPRSQRKRMEKYVDRLRITGMAMRSYVSGSASLYQEDDVYTVSIVLAQMENRTAAGDLARSQSEFLASLDMLRKGPKVGGHEDAACFLPPEDRGRVIEAVFCSAHVGNVLVTVTAQGTAPMDGRSVAALVREQLDRIDEPGKAV
ncbi:hypothetical protein CP969_18620 [Streptomyces viridosporus T7A]|uniref:Secreted protein n=1 Tax=Streptomyces viridosporus T7A TaxID=665577 RepID=A0ABX6AHE9_STRVD|nr:hypothetical protein CP969_18620 [Streptomyces viridosporus T7A]